MNLIKELFLLTSRNILLVGLSFATTLAAQDSKFTVVIDAGHGGHDPGAIGAISREKDINLAVSLNLGGFIEQKYKDVKVVYTRKTDKYLTLQERANVVNNNHADLFICIHTNSSPSASAYGAESYTMGLAKSKGNLDVAMRENSVITLEDDYKAKYQGFDPRSVDSYIMFEFMQDKYLDRSVSFASTIQKQFSSYCNRSDRGVRQAGFWVLAGSACPSVLVELGFISNPAEERYLSSDLGQNEMSQAVFNAFTDYKREHDKKSGRQSVLVSKFEQAERKAESAKEDQISKTAKVKPEVQDSTKPQLKEVVQSQVAEKKQTIAESTPKVAEAAPVKSVVQKVDVKQQVRTEKEAVSTAIPVFKVQILASAKKLQADASDFKGVKDVDCFVEGAYNKYTVGSETDYSKIEKIREKILSKFPEAFIIAFVGDKKMSAKEAIKLIK